MDHFKFDDSIGFLVNRAAIRLKNELWKAFKVHGFSITPEQWGVLNCLWEEDRQTQTEIAERILKDKTNLTRMLDVMEREALVVRRPHETDRRSYRIYLTPNGKKLKKKLIPIAIEINEASIQNLSVREKKELKRLMNAVNRNLA
ncbi:MAG: MarR family transcriptional regulator [Deltaproteobacteria bacterium]|nr:MarR family transcriptional regulator [Deltaproteobacteria bacterium]